MHIQLQLLDITKGPQHLEKGLIVGKRWKIVDKLGEGGCGAVYKVQDIQTFAKVIKLITPY